MKQKTKKKTGKRITTDDLKTGFRTIAEDDTGYIMKYKKRLGLSAGERLLTKWK